MERLFLHIFNTSIVAMWLVLAIILIRLCLRKLPKRLMMGLWLLVALRLIFPFSIESIFSLVPSRHTIPAQVLTDGIPQIHSGFSGFNTAINPILESRAKIEIAESTVKVMPAVRLTTIVSIIWIIGLATMLILALVSYTRLRRQVREAVRDDDNIYLSEHIVSPFILGIIRPRVYLPLHLTDEEKAYVIAHERAHIKRKDHWIKPLAYILLSTFWFNPLLWVAYILLSKDIEMACDERVVKDLSSSEKARYSSILLSLSVNHRGVQACPLAFGQGDVKKRVVNILNYKKPAFWIIVAVLVIAIAVGVFFLTDPIRKKEEPAKSTPALVDTSNTQTTHLFDPDARYYRDETFIWDGMNNENEMKNGLQRLFFIELKGKTLTVELDNGKRLLDQATPFESKVMTRDELKDAINEQIKEQTNDPDFHNTILNTMPTGEIDVLTYRGIDTNLTYSLYMVQNEPIWLTQDKLTVVFKLESFQFSDANPHEMFASLSKQYPTLSELDGTYHAGELIAQPVAVSSRPRHGDFYMTVESEELQVFNDKKERLSIGTLSSVVKSPMVELKEKLDRKRLPLFLEVDFPSGDSALILTFSTRSGREHYLVVFEDGSIWGSNYAHYFELLPTSNESFVIKEYTGKRLLWQESTLDNRPKDGSEYWIILLNEDALSIVRRDGSKLFDHAKPYKKMTTNKENLTEELDSRSFREYFSHQIPPGDIEANFYKTAAGEVYGIYSSMGRAIWLTHGENMHRVFELSAGNGKRASEVLRGLCGTTLMNGNYFNPMARTESLDGSYIVGELLVQNAFRAVFTQKNDAGLFERMTIESGMLKVFNDKGDMTVMASETQTGWMETTDLRPLIYDYMLALIAENQFPVEGRVLVTIYEAGNNSSFFIFTFSDGTKWFATYNFGEIFEISGTS